MEANGDKRNPDGTFAVGYAGGPGAPIQTEEQKIVKKAQKEFIAEYKEKLSEALPLISPVLIAKAIEGDMAAIKEVNDRVMGKAQQDITSAGEKIEYGVILYPQKYENPLEARTETGDSTTTDSV